ncbi:MAG: hypothetical protein WC699_18675 [Bacteroidales bacterium]|jgi:hypothetical protein
MTAQETNAASLVTVEGFVNRYFKHLKVCKTNTEAYEKTAEEYREAFGHDKYSGYDSFRRVKNRKFKQN